MFKFEFSDGIYTEKQNAVTRFRLSPGRDFDKWVYQNEAVYIGDFVPGCLVDNFVMATKRGFAAFYENYVNCWTSDFLVEFQPGPAQAVFRKWYKFEEENEND